MVKPTPDFFAAAVATGTEDADRALDRVVGHRVTGGAGEVAVDVIDLRVVATVVGSLARI